MSTNVVTVEVASTSEMTPEEIGRMYDLLIRAYALTEVEIWGENYVRMSLEEYIEHIHAGEVLVARISRIVVGTIHVYRNGPDSFGFGLLAADFDRMGMGIGRTLIEAAESIARKAGAKRMTLEILRPRDFALPVKQQLDAWYRRQGYSLTESMSFTERKPDKAEKAKGLIVPAVFDCYEKQLNARN